ncbi:hypothetical protein IV203_003332 [Nitzschia inconspicua]|uniref:Uncharacterized protein n=1 Tax=Nitzschia inconspicua TaxID=303405 RepID=A0A9K3L3B5_9STRA|nr:hypothetical protein IV203_003332 [Nitzschia inconspicua]
MVLPGAAATPPRRGVGGGVGGPGSFHLPYPYEYENVSPGTPYTSRGGAGSGGPPPHSPYPPYYRGGGPPPPHSDYWGGGPEGPTTPSHRGGGYWGPPPHHSGPYHEGFRMGPPPIRSGITPYPHHRSPLRRPFVSPGEPLSPHHSYDQHRKDFRPPAPASAVRGSGKKPEEKELEKSDSESINADESSNKDKTNGDPLSVLADVSAGMDGKDKKKDRDSNDSSVTAGDGDDSKMKETEGKADLKTPRRPVPVPAPTSPLQRRAKPSPITPSQTPYDRKGGSGASSHPTTPGRHQPITPSRSQDSASIAAGGSWGDAPPIPPGVSSEVSYPPHEYPPHHQGPYTPVRSRGGRPPYGDLPPPTDSPALVERGSFDSHGDASSYRVPPFPPATPPSRAFFYDDGPPPGYGSGNGGSYWEAAGPSPYSPSYHAPSRGGPGSWNPPPPPPPGHDPYYGMSHGPPPPDYPHGPPLHYGEEDAAAMGPGIPYGHGPPPPHYRGPPPPPHHHPGSYPPPYGYLHPPRMEEKTILRKKFSWKHYPELERFLIANRDEYLKHSQMNYTAEQKQYNNWLTERLLEVAAQHSYLFDPEDFNFVAIRDRIRCYYKSYVQTARKRGLKLPEKKKD